MPRPHSDWIRRVLLAAVIVMPLLAGAIYVGIKPTFDATDHRPNVALICPTGQPDTSPGPRLAAQLGDSSGFQWHRVDADNAARGLSDGSLMAAVVIPDRFGSADAGGTYAQQVTVTPGRRDLDAPTYAELVQQVSAAANRIGVGNLMVAVSKARGDLGHAQFVAAIIKAAAGQANDQFVSAFANVDKMVARAKPVMAGAKTMLATIQQVGGQVDQVANMLSVAGSSTRGINLTIGDIQSGATAVGNGAQATNVALSATAPFRDQVRSVIGPIASALQAGNIPGISQLSGQLDSLLALLDGPTPQPASGRIGQVRTGAAMVASQMNNLSGLLDAKVDKNTQVSAVLTLGANRLRTLSSFMSQGRDTITQVLGQVSQATTQLPGMEAAIKSKLQQFQSVTTQLVTSLGAGTRELPSGPNGNDTDAAGTSVSAAGPPVTAGGLSVDAVARAVLVLLVGALLIALGRVWSTVWLADRGLARVADPVTVIVALVPAGIGLAVVGSVPRADSAFAILVLASVALTAFAVALMSLLGEKIGSITWVVLLGATIILGGGLHGQQNAAARFVARLLPGSYATTGVGDAAALGIGSALIVPTVVLAAVGILSTAAVIAERTGRPGGLGPALPT